MYLKYIENKMCTNSLFFINHYSCVNQEFFLESTESHSYQWGFHSLHLRKPIWKSLLGLESIYQENKWGQPHWLILSQWMSWTKMRLSRCKWDLLLVAFFTYEISQISEKYMDSRLNNQNIIDNSFTVISRNGLGKLTRITKPSTYRHHGNFAYEW